MEHMSFILVVESYATTSLTAIEAYCDCFSLWLANQDIIHFLLYHIFSPHLRTGVGQREPVEQHGLEQSIVCHPSYVA